MKRKIPLLSSVLLFILLGGCAETANVVVRRPAEINMSSYRQLAIGEVQGNWGAPMVESLVVKLVESQYFDVLDRGNIHRPSLAGAGRDAARNPSALLSVTSNSDFRQTTKISDAYKDDDGKPYRFYHKIGEGTLYSFVKITDVHSGRIVFARSYTESDTDDQWEKNHWPDDIDANRLLMKVTDKTAGKIMKAIAPSLETVQITFEEADNPDIEAGIRLAQAGQWEQAVSYFKRTTDADPTSYAGWYDLGLAYEYSGLYREAIHAFSKACVIKSSSRCLNEMANCKRLEGDMERLREQETGR
jgi:tetratricopeptide (TPR) repeat protein